MGFITFCIVWLGVGFMSVLWALYDDAVDSIFKDDKSIYQCIALGFISLFYVASKKMISSDGNTNLRNKLHNSVNRKEDKANE